MGGRGGSGGASSRAGGSAGFKEPKLSGSEKQVSYAKDILRKPYERIERAQKSEETLVKRLGKADAEAKKAKAYSDAKSEYRKAISALEKQSGGVVKASSVIERKGIFDRLAEEVVVKTFRDRGLDSASALANLRRF